MFLIGIAIGVVVGVLGYKVVAPYVLALKAKITGA